MRRGLGIAVVSTIALAVTACGSSGGSKSSSGGGGGSSGSVSGAKTLAASAMNSPPKGTITYCTGKDTTGAAAYVVAQFNAKYGAQGYTPTWCSSRPRLTSSGRSSSSASRRSRAPATCSRPT